LIDVVITFYHGSWYAGTRSKGCDPGARERVRE